MRRAFVEESDARIEELDRLQSYVDERRAYFVAERDKQLRMIDAGTVELVVAGVSWDDALNQPAVAADGAQTDFREGTWEGNLAENPGLIADWDQSMKQAVDLLRKADQFFFVAVPITFGEETGLATAYGFKGLPEDEDESRGVQATVFELLHEALAVILEKLSLPDEEGEEDDAGD